MTTLSAMPINCSLKRSGGVASSTDAMVAVLAVQFTAPGVAITPTLRIADHDVRPGVTADEGDGDAWPDLRRRISAS